MIVNRSIHRLKYFAAQIFSTTILWVLGALICVYIKFNDLTDHTIIEVYDFQPIMTKTKLYELAFFISFLLGITMSLTRVFLYPFIIKTRNFPLSLFLRSLVFLSLALGILSLFFKLSSLPPIQFYASHSTLLNNPILDLLIYLLLVEGAVGITVTLRNNMGKNYIRRLIRNTYFDPREEYRVFMFTDLEHSTELVERMGNLFFSKFIQDCFADFSSVSLDYGADIYQYVGDEVVTTWETHQRFAYADCIALHFAFIEKLQKRKNYYLDNYGAIPGFRSSIHCGKVSAALVGGHKTEIAYHGGVLNLCSRLQSVCRDYKAELVISELFYQKITGKHGYSLEAIANIELKGIAAKQLVYKVTV